MSEETKAKNLVSVFGMPEPLASVKKRRDSKTPNRSAKVPLLRSRSEVTAFSAQCPAYPCRQCKTMHAD